MKDTEIKNLFAGLNIEGPSANFEERIIKNALAKKPAAKPSYFPRYVAVAAMFLFVFSFGLMNFNDTQKIEQQYASLVDDGSIVNDDDVYDDIIVAYNY